MKLHQMRYIREVARHGCNVSMAAEALHTSQPGVSKQIQLLEEELGLQIFNRNGKRLTGITEPGQLVLQMAERVLLEIESIRRVGEEFCRTDTGTLTVATTHTQARYRLPPAVKAFTEQFPNVRLNIHQGNPTQVAELVINGEADIGIATEGLSNHPELVTLPCYQWNRCVVTPQGHPLLQETPLTLEKIARYPVVTYDFAFAGGSLVNRIFSEAGVDLNVVFTAIDSDVVKTYVELGMGIGLLAQMAYNPELDASHLFPNSTTLIALRRDGYLRGFAYAFLHHLAPHLDRATVDAVLGE